MLALLATVGCSIGFAGIATDSSFPAFVESHPWSSLVLFLLGAYEALHLGFYLLYELLRDILEWWYDLKSSILERRGRFERLSDQERAARSCSSECRKPSLLVRAEIATKRKLNESSEADDETAVLVNVRHPDQETDYHE